MLVLTENYAALPIVQKELHKKGKEPVIIFGSSFPKDQEYTKVLTVISAFPLVPWKPIHANVYQNKFK